MKAMKSLGVILLAAVLLVCGVSASAEAPEAGDFSFAGGVRFGESMDEALNRLYEQDIDCLDFREAYG